MGASLSRAWFAFFFCPFVGRFALGRSCASPCRACSYCRPVCDKCLDDGIAGIDVRMLGGTVVRSGTAGPLCDDSLQFWDPLVLRCVT